MLQFLLASFHVTDEAHKPLAEVPITVKWRNQEGKDHEQTARTSDDGSAIFPVPQSALPLLPSEGHYEVTHPKGAFASGKVIVGGNQHVHTQEIVLKVA